MHVRDAQEVEIDQLAKLWYDGWLDAHLQIVPEQLARLRTLESFRERLQKGLSNVRVAGQLGAPVGFYMLKGTEIYQLYVSAESRGSEVAARLIADAEARLSQIGVEAA